MKRSQGWVVPALLALAAGGPAKEAAEGDAELKAAARAVVQRLAKEDFAGTFRLFEPELADWLPEARLRQQWGDVVRRAGAFKRQNEPAVKRRPTGVSVTVPCDF